MKISIVYHSQTGNTKKVAECIANGIKKYGEIEIQLMSIDSIDKDFLEDSKAVIFGTPTYFTSMSWQMKQWFDTTRYNLSGKLGACFATANFMGGGSEFAEINLITHMLCKGMLVYSAGGSQGQPFTHMGAVAIQSGDDFQKNRAEIFGERIAKKALELFE